MPFIITTTRTSPPIDLTDPDYVSVSRHAVATLDEARGQVEEIVDQITGEAVASEIPKTGGVVTLSGGTVIEITPTLWVDLIADYADGSGITRDMTAAEWQAAIIAAHNAQESS